MAGEARAGSTEDQTGTASAPGGDAMPAYPDLVGVIGCSVEPSTAHP